MEMNSGPHQSSRGNRLASMKPTIMRSAGDQVSIGPIGVLDQSNARMRSPISPPPASHPAAGFTSEGADLDMARPARDAAGAGVSESWPSPGLGRVQIMPRRLTRE